MNRLLLPSLVLAACSQPTKQPAPVTGDAAEAPAPEPRSEPAPRAGSNLFEIVAVARQCAEERLDAKVGQSGTPLVLDKHYLIEPTARSTWKVTFTEENPSARPYGRSFEVDAAKQLCDGRPLASPASASARSDADAVVSSAKACAQQAPHEGQGVCGSALLLDQPTLHYLSATSWLVSFPEASPRCAPQGRDLIISADGSSCSAAPMD